MGRPKRSFPCCPAVCLGGCVFPTGDLVCSIAAYSDAACTTLIDSTLQLMSLVVPNVWRTGCFQILESFTGHPPITTFHKVQFACEGAGAGLQPTIRVFRYTNQIGACTGQLPAGLMFSLTAICSPLFIEALCRSLPVPTPGPGPTYWHVTITE